MLDFIKQAYLSTIENGWLNSVIEMLSIILILLTFLSAKKFWIIGTIILFGLFLFTDSTTIGWMFLFNLVFIVLVFSFSFLSTSYRKILESRFDTKTEYKKSKLFTGIIIVSWIIGIIWCVVIFFVWLWRVLTGNVPYYIIFLLAVPILTVAIYIVRELYIEAKVYIFIHYILLSDLSHLKETIKNLWFEWYLENISENTINKFINLKHPNFIINNLRQEIPEVNIVHSMMEREEQQSILKWERNKRVNSYKNVLEKSEQEKKDLKKLKTYVSRLNDMFGMFYMGIIFEKLREQKELHSEFIVETIFLLYIVHTLGRYDSLKEQELSKWGSVKTPKILKNKSATHYDTVIAIRNKKVGIIWTSEDIF